MKHLLDLVEKILIVQWKIFLFIVRAVSFIHEAIMKVLGIVISLLMVLTALWLINLLPLYWQALVLRVIIIGASASFLCTVAIRIWRPEKFFSIFGAKI